MSEKINNPYEGLSSEEIEMYEAYMADHPEESTPAESRVDCKERFAIIEERFAQFEKDFDLEALFAITDLKPEDAPNHPIREPARKALIPIAEDLKFLKEKTDITEEALDILIARYKRISQAVGMINKNIVDHTR